MNQKGSDKTIEKDLRISMEDVFFERLETIKTYYGIKNNTEIVRFMINEKYRDIAPSENIQDINERIIAPVLKIFNQYRKKGELQVQDLANALNISMNKLLRLVSESKQKIDTPIDLLSEE